MGYNMEPWADNMGIVLKAATKPRLILFLEKDKITSTIKLAYFGKRKKLRHHAKIEDKKPPGVESSASAYINTN